METGCHRCLAAGGPCSHKNGLCLPKVVNDKLGECEASTCEMCATGEEKQQSLFSWIPLSIWRRLTKQNSHSRSYTFHTLSTQLDSSGGRSSFHAASAKGQSHVTAGHNPLHARGFVKIRAETSFTPFVTASVPDFDLVTALCCLKTHV